MKKRLIFFRGLIHTLDLYTDEFVRMYTECGDDCLVLEASDMENEMLRLKAFLIRPVTAVLSFNNVGLHLELEGDRNVWDQFGIPFYNIMMDHPFHYKKALDTAPKQMILLCMDKNHVEYVRRFFPNIKKTEFFPHAGIERGGNFIPVAQRKIDVLYAGGLSRYAAEGLIPDLGSIDAFDAFALVKRALERLIMQPELTTEAVIEDCLKEIKLEFDDKELGKLIAELRFLDSFAVSYYRELFVRTLAENGVTVTVFGAGWDRCEWDSDNLIYGGVIPPEQILELMRQSKIVLNTMTWFKRGAHDRIFNGMLAKAAVVSDTSEYLEEHFLNRNQMYFFALNEAQKMAETVKDLLEHPHLAQDAAERGYETARGQHMWRNRLNNISAIAMEKEQRLCSLNIKEF